MTRSDFPRIAFVSPSPYLAGAERALINLLRHLPDREIQPVVLFPYSDGPVKKIVKQALGIPVFELHYWPSLPIIGQEGFWERMNQETAEFSNIFKELELDAVVVNTSVVYPAAVASIHAGVPFLVHSHGAINPQLFPRLDLQVWHKIESLQLNLADKVLVPSSWVAAVCRRTGSPFLAEVTILPNGIELPTLHEEVDAVLEPRVPEFVMLCTIEPNKGVHIFLDSALRVLSRRPAGATFTVYGDGEEKYRDSLISYIYKHNLETSVAIYPKQSNVDSIYRRCHAVIVASEVESFSLVTVEAMSYAKPVISTRCGGPEEIIKDGQTGYLIAQHDSESLAERMIRLMDDPSLGQDMGLAGRELAKSNYNIETLASVYLEHILDMVDSQTNFKSLSLKKLLVSCNCHSLAPVFSPVKANPGENYSTSELVSNHKMNSDALATYSSDDQILLNTLRRIIGLAGEAF